MAMALTPTPHQIECQTALLLFRGAGHPASQLDAIVCFPSFHVIWAIFCVAALWGFRFLRIPVSLLAGMIIISTVTTGWHYFIDVLGGIVIAGLSLAIAKACTEASKDCRQRVKHEANTMTERNVANQARLIVENVATGDWVKHNFASETLDLPWWVLLANRIELARRRMRSSIDLAFHIRMAYGCLTVLIVSFVGCRLTSIHTNISGRVIAIVVAFGMIAPLPIYWHEKGRTAFREAALAIPWTLLLAVTLSFPVLIAARLRMPLQDSLFGRTDQWLGVSVPAITAWAKHHWLGRLVQR